MPAATIEWDEEAAGMRLRKDGHIAGMSIASVGPRHDPDGSWWMSVYIGPLPPHMNDLCYADYACEEDAKRTAQEILDQYTDMLVAGTAKEEEEHERESGLQRGSDTGGC